MKTIKIHDTTLRDGEQAPDNTMTPREKLLVAKKLSNIGVDTIEAGFPSSSKEDFEAVKLISSSIKNTTICAFGRCTKEDIDKCYEALNPAKDKSIFIFYPASDLHLSKKLGVDRSTALLEIRKNIKYAKKYFKKIRFGLEDATRADLKFIYNIIDILVKEEVDVIVVGDTTGYITPDEFYTLIKNIKKYLDNKIQLAIHCHNDLGMATANTLAGILAGADEIETTINGIGERSGNASLEEVVAALKVRHDFYKCKTNIKTREIFALSQLVYKILKRNPSHEKSVVGVNSFRHEAGIHINGLKKDPSTYEILKPEEFGRKRKFVKGRHSSNK